MERRFACTACGKCCHGWLPLTLKDALENAGRFPLALVWTVVGPASKAFALTGRLGTMVRLPNRKTVAVRVVPTSYLPPAEPCPALLPSNLCSIQETKPSRCRSMPFFPYQEEGEQAPFLTPRPGWQCDTSETAPVVYRDRRIVERDTFDAESRDLLAQARLMRAHADATLAVSPGLLQDLFQVSRKAGGGHVVTGFTSLLPRLASDDVLAFARRQLPVLRDFAARSALPADYLRRYRDWSQEVANIAAFASQREEPLP